MRSQNDIHRFWRRPRRKSRRFKKGARTRIDTQIVEDEREDCRDMGVTKEEVEIALNSSLNPSHLVVIDTSGGCGASFEVTIVSEHFEGKRLLERHRLVNTALAEQMKQIHALSIKKAVTPAQWNPNPTASQQ
ncbi:unnamed protein product [Musa acuminata subsp. malaccensis]|uniref:(wild Malaysian banana) hypothetical protein n=2 Tax=Musa acuminata TaxID=4641 RepID=A0A804JIJ5_MUSAM|nr:PREDICTED: protein BOLA2 [Musa acuminata subsp. malaccensis]CAG1846884.1 unnamed protein product [Musa acuminata subsp. malaccensis]